MAPVDLGETSEGQVRTAATLARSFGFGRVSRALSRPGASACAATCPLTPIAARYTNDRRPNFDIYLPERLARHNKSICGAVYVGGLLFTLARWTGWLW